MPLWPHLHAAISACGLTCRLCTPHPSCIIRTLLMQQPHFALLTYLQSCETHVASTAESFQLWQTLPATVLHRPFLLQSKASYTQIGIFSVASYPYSFKLLWSPIVDSIYSLAFGRRKSWVVPIQFGSSLILLFSAKWLAGR